MWLRTGAEIFVNEKICILPTTHRTQLQFQVGECYNQKFQVLVNSQTSKIQCTSLKRTLGAREHADVILLEFSCDDRPSGSAFRTTKPVVDLIFWGRLCRSVVGECKGEGSCVVSAYSRQTTVYRVIILTILFLVNGFQCAFIFLFLSACDMNAA